tara:strand:+ start:10553 stop:11404 length:852 start_codon:yes stop_codon:yes gene_type:complete
MIRYTFVSLGKFESLGFRLGGAGLGNILFPWARSIVYARKYKLQRLQTTWFNLKLGTIIRNERDTRMYYNLFTGRDGISGLRKFLLLNFSNRVKYFSGMEDMFEPFKNDHAFIKDELLRITNPYHIDMVNKYDTNSIAVHIRMGDFQKPKSETMLRNSNWNYRLPLKWYINIIKKIRSISNLPIFIFSDASDNEIKEILAINNCTRVFLGSSISDMFAISNSKLLVASASTFSMWASFIGQIPTIWFPGQLRQRIIVNSNIFEGEIDYDDKLDDKLIHKLHHA